MTFYGVIFTPEADEQLVALYRSIAIASSPEVAQRYALAIVKYCEGLSTFPLRGKCRDDIRPGIRITNFRRRVVIAFTVDFELVSIVGVFYGGRDYETALQSSLLL